MSYHIALHLRSLRSGTLAAALILVHLAHTALGVHGEAVEQMLVAVAATND